MKSAAQFAGFTPAAVLFGLFFIVPLGLIVVYSFWRTKDYSLVHDWNLGNYRTFIHTRTYLKTFLKTVLMGVLATVTTIGLAMPFCYWLVRYVSKRLQRTLLLLVVLPFWTSYLLRVYSWVAILGDNGALNTVLNKVGVTSGAHRYLLYDNPGVYLVLVYLYFPFAVLTLYASLERFDWNLLRAARD
ncbi:MAG: ABC transporter permease, partial [Ilumatobacteraceae bacterium]